MQLCSLALESKKRCYWKVQTVTSDGRIGRLESDVLSAGIKTEVAYYFETDRITVFIVGFSFDVIPFRSKTLQFIYGIAYSIYVAAYGLDEEDDGGILPSSRDSARTLDEKEFQPRPFTSSNALNSYSSQGSDVNTKLDRTVLRSTSGSQVGYSLPESPPRRRDSADSTAGGGVWQQRPSVSKNLYKNGEKGSNDEGMYGLSLNEAARAKPLVCHAQDDKNPHLRTAPMAIRSNENDNKSPSMPNNKSFEVQVDRARSMSNSHVEQLTLGTSVASTVSATPPFDAMDKVEEMHRNVWNKAESPRGPPSGASAVASSLTGDKADEEEQDRPGQGSPLVRSKDGKTSQTTDSIEGQPMLLLDEQGDEVDEVPGSVASKSSQQTADSNVIVQGETQETVIVQSSSIPPTWEPVDPFSFPVAKVAIRNWVPDNLEMEHFTDVQYVADGSNSNIFLAKLNGEKVVIKMIKMEIQFDSVAVHEFDVEHGMLARINHRNIIKLKGAGQYPRRFLVLEWLGGGTLNAILEKNQVKAGLAQKLFRKPSFSYPNLLARAREIVEALRFLHSQCHLGATVIHRDLKPDNIGFTSSGHLKLFDFGLCTCVKLRSNVNESYEMTGNTGSLRYMAPEVAQKKPYNEKADVYSFAIVLWQMARDKVPFKGMTRDMFMTDVIIGGERPKLDKSWPRSFSNMLVKSWDPDHRMRPSFAELVVEIDALLGALAWRHGGLGQMKVAKDTRKAEVEALSEDHDASNSVPSSGSNSMRSDNRSPDVHSQRTGGPNAQTPDN